MEYKQNKWDEKLAFEFTVVDTLRESNLIFIGNMSGTFDEHVWSENYA